MVPVFFPFLHLLTNAQSFCLPLLKCFCIQQKSELPPLRVLKRRDITDLASPRATLLILQESQSPQATYSWRVVEFRKLQDAAEMLALSTNGVVA